MNHAINTAAIVITTKTLVNGVDIATLADSAIYDLIAKQEAAVADLEKIDNKPKKLVNEIAKRKAGIQALVDYLDSKEPADKADATTSAAEAARKYQRNPSAMVGCFDVFDSSGNAHRVDLDDEPEEQQHAQDQNR